MGILYYTIHQAAYSFSREVHNGSVIEAHEPAFVSLSEEKENTEAEQVNIGRQLAAGESCRNNEPPASVRIEAVTICIQNVKLNIRMQIWTA